MIDLLTQPKGTVYWIVVVIAGIAMTWIYFANLKHRFAIEAALEKAAGAAGQARGEKAPEPPEHVWSYDQRYLVAFHALASAHPIEAGSRETILDRYIRPVLLWNDVAFAFAMAAFIALLMFGLAPCVPWRWASQLVLAGGCMGILYGVVDLLEDVRLARLLKNPTAITEWDATVANFLTRTKIVTLGASVSGGIAFKALQEAGKRFK